MSRAIWPAGMGGCWPRYSLPRRPCSSAVTAEKRTEWGGMKAETAPVRSPRTTHKNYDRATIQIRQAHHEDHRPCGPHVGAYRLHNQAFFMTHELAKQLKEAGFPQDDTYFVVGKMVFHPVEFVASRRRGHSLPHPLRTYRSVRGWLSIFNSKGANDKKRMDCIWSYGTL